MLSKRLYVNTSLHVLMEYAHVSHIDWPVYPFVFRVLSILLYFTLHFFLSIFGMLEHVLVGMHRIVL